MQKLKTALKRLSLQLVLLTAASMMVLSMPTTASAEALTKDLQLVGDARLNKLFWTIYDSRLYTPSGQYHGIEPGLTLEIIYRRTISSKQLVNSTREEWQELDIYKQPTSEQWLKQLSNIWPDVVADNTITLRVGDDLNSYFFFNEKAIGHIDNHEFTGHFLAIWLSPDTRYPKLQKRLTGAK